MSNSNHLDPNSVPPDGPKTLAKSPELSRRKSSETEPSPLRELREGRGVRIINGDCRDVLKALPDQSVHCCVTSPPYFGLRDYGHEGQIGLEPTPDDFVAAMVDVFREVRRVLRDDGTLWLNLGDSYAGSWSGNSMRPLGGSQRAGKPGFHPLDDGRYTPRGGKTFGLKPKDLIGIPWRVAFALQADGWYLRQDIIWSKPNPMPESVQDRCTKAHEYLFLLSKGSRYYFDTSAIAEPASVPEGAGNASGNRYIKAAETDPRMRTKAGLAEIGARDTRNKRSVWTVATQPFKEAHFATFPPELIEPCIKAGSPAGGMVLDPFGGAGTTGLVADRLGRDALLIELNPEYAAMAEGRIRKDAGLFAKIEGAAA